MVNVLTPQPQFSSLSLVDLLTARDQFHAHLLHKQNVIGTAVGRYLIRKSDPYPTKSEPDSNKKTPKKEPRTLENSEVREYSWPCILVFVSEWVEERNFGKGSQYSAFDFVPKAVYLQDGRTVPLCVVLSPLWENALPPVDIASLKFPKDVLQCGFPITSQVQGAEHVATVGCLVSDGHTIYALTNRHVAGRPGEKLYTYIDGKRQHIANTADAQLGKMPFERVYESWPGKHVFVNLDVGLAELLDQTKWSTAVFGIGQVGPLADLSTVNMTLNLIDAPVRANACVSGLLLGKISALFYRYKSIGGTEYVADFLIGSRNNEPLQTRPGDSASLWVLETEDAKSDRMPLALQWGGASFSGENGRFSFALATSLSTVCRELDVDLYRSGGSGQFEYWGVVGHYMICALACGLVADANLKTLMMANQIRVSFDPANINAGLNDLAVPDFIPLADVPDKVWKKKKSQETPYGRKGLENPNHYADIDFKRDTDGKTLIDLTPNAAALQANTWRQYYTSIHWSAVSQRGLLPFRVWQIYMQMVAYVAGQDVAGFVAAAGVLAHYVGDASQPLHGSYLDDGDPFRDPDGTATTTMHDHSEGYAHGVHKAYEDRMVDVHVGDLRTNLPGAISAMPALPLVNGGQEAGFATIELMKRARGYIDPMTLVNAYGTLVDHHQTSSASTELWTQLAPRPSKRWPTDVVRWRCCGTALGTKAAGVASRPAN